MTNTIDIFFAYAQADESLRNALEKHLSTLKRQGFITGWHDQKILPGQEWEQEAVLHLRTAQIILLLVSPDFLASDYADRVELKMAMERHQRGEANVIPVLLRPVDWKYEPFGKLRVLPSGERPVTSWLNQDEGFLSVAQGIREVVEKKRGTSTISSKVKDKDIWEQPSQKVPVEALADQDKQNTQQALKLAKARQVSRSESTMPTEKLLEREPPVRENQQAAFAYMANRPASNNPKHSRRALMTLIVSVVLSLAIISGIAFGVVSCVAQQYQLKPPTGFTVTSTVLQGGQLMQRGQALVNADIPLTIQGTCALQGAGLVWAVLHDPYGNYYLQNPPIQFNGGGTWSVTNITPKSGIATIDFVAVTPNGNGTFQQKVSNGDFSAFTYAQFPQDSLILRATISVNTSQLSS